MFISPANPEQMLYNINILGTLNRYAIGNPLYFSISRNNIYPSMSLFWDMPELNWWQQKFVWWSNLPNWIKWTTGIGVIVGLSILIAATKGATAPILMKAAKILAGAKTGAMVGGGTGAIFGAISDGWDGAASGFALGTIGGTMTGGYSGLLSSQGKVVGALAVQHSLKMGVFSAGTTGTLGFSIQGPVVFRDWTFYVAMGVSFIGGSISTGIESGIEGTAFAESKKGILLGIGLSVAGPVLDEVTALITSALSGEMNTHELLILKRL